MGRKRNKNKKAGNVIHYQPKAKQHEDKSFAKDNIATEGFHVNIPLEVYQKVMHWVNKSEYEVSWFGDIDFDRENKRFNILNAHLVKQENSRASTDICEVDMGRLMYEKRDVENGLRWWGHSHVDMNVFWSGTDMATIRELGRNGWVLATVFNKKREMLSAYLQSVDVLGHPHDIFVNEIKTTIGLPEQDQLAAQWDKEYDDHVKNISYNTYSYTSKGKHYAGSYPGDDRCYWYNDTWMTEEEYHKAIEDEYYDSYGWPRGKTRSLIDGDDSELNEMSSDNVMEDGEAAIRAANMRDYLYRTYKDQVTFPSDWNNAKQIGDFYDSIDEIVGLTQEEKNFLEEECVMRMEEEIDYA